MHKERTPHQEKIEGGYTAIARIFNWNIIFFMQKCGIWIYTHAVGGGVNVSYAALVD